MELGFEMMNKCSLLDSGIPHVSLQVTFNMFGHNMNNHFGDVSKVFRYHFRQYRASQYAGFITYLYFEKAIVLYNYFHYI